MNALARKLGWLEKQTVLEYLLPTLSKFMQSADRPRLPQGLDVVVGPIKPDVLALTALNPLINNFIAGIAGDKSKPQRRAIKVRIAMGESLHRAWYAASLPDKKLRPLRKMRRSEAIRRSGYRDEWSDKQKLWAGNWLLRCCLRGLPDVFGLDRDRVPFVHEWFEEFLPELCADLALHRDPVIHPSTEPPHPWTGWKSTSIPDATFVRKANSDTKKAVQAAFSNDTMQEHVDGVNSLQAVGWTINQKMLRVVKQFAGEDRSAIYIPGKRNDKTIEKKREELRRRIGREGLSPKGGGVGKKVSALIVARDLAIAEGFVGKTFYVPHNCDFRGRVYPIPHFNFSREDHVRCLFLFANGMPINAYDGYSGFKGIELLMIHVANCADFKDADGRRISKRPFGERVEWVKNYRAPRTMPFSCMIVNPCGSLAVFRGD